MPRGRRKVRGGILLTLQNSERGGSSDSFGAPRTKETRLDSVDSDQLSEGSTSSAPPPLLALNPSQLLHHSVSSPSRSLRDKITDYFGYNNEDSEDLYRSRSCSPEMPVLMPQVVSPGDSQELPASPESPESCGNSDSGKENEETEPEIQRLQRPRSDSNKMPLQQQQQPVAAGRVTRSASGKVPVLSLKGCESLQNELNMSETTGGLKGGSEVGGQESSSPLKASIAQSPPTPHKIIRVKESINPLNKLKSISLTPKKSTKSSKQTKRQSPPVASSVAQQQAPTNTTNTKAGKLQAAANTSHKVTEYFPIRRSERKPKAELLKEELETIGESLAVTDDSRHGIEVAPIENKGRGIKAVKTFDKGDFVVEYAGDLIDIGTAKDLETKYSMDASKGCYMYYFKHKGKQYCIDGTEESGRYGRLLNHSRVTPNCITKVVMIKDVPRLILVAKQSISPGEELLYDYGDRSKESLKAHPWLAL